MLEWILPEYIYFKSLQFFIPLLDHRRRGAQTLFYEENGFFVAESSEFKYYFCSAYNAGRYMFRDKELQVESKLLKKYTDSGRFKISESQTIVDIGANIGEFTLAVAKIADKVIAIEPDSTVFNCLKKNTEGMSAVTALEYAIGPKDGESIFYSSYKRNDSSLYKSEDVDVEEVIVTQKTLKTVLTECNLHKIDLLKVEAEGFEPEILRSALDVLSEVVRKVAVDGGPERDGKPTADECINILKEAGHKVWKNGHMVYSINEKFGNESV